MYRNCFGVNSCIVIGMYNILLFSSIKFCFAELVSDDTRQAQEVKEKRTAKNSVFLDLFQDKKNLSAEKTDDHGGVIK